MSRRYFELFVSSFVISAFTFGGGYAIVPLFKRKFVDDLRLMSEEEMLNLIAIAQAAPGAMAINTAMLAGYKTAGLGGAACAVVGTVLPPLVVISAVSVFYRRLRDSYAVSAALAAMAPAVAATVASAVWSLGRGVIKSRGGALAALAAFVAAAVFRVNVMYIVLAFAAAGFVSGFLRPGRGGR
ncbi:MAG: chromate transporter [Clostridiales bacterium]|jgi:chromate transporter|nr:chromate transporter [Clostridiales bacterium]